MRLSNLLFLLLLVSILSCKNSGNTDATSGNKAPEQVTESAKQELPGGPYEDISVEEFRGKMKNPDVIILDVRTPEETALGMIEKATELNFYSPSFDQVVKFMDQEKTYLIYCAVGQRSAETCKKLSKLGFKRLYNLAGGYEAWKKAGF
jgi:rhodanese-related sulfurtransferase